MSQFGGPPGYGQPGQPPAYSKATRKNPPAVSAKKPVAAMQWNTVANPIRGSWSTGVAPVTLTATWQTPILDLRPELASVVGQSDVGQKIWSYTQGWSNWPELFVQVDLNADPAGPTQDLEGMRVTAFERTSVGVSGELGSQVQLSGTEYDVSAYFHQAGLDAAMLSFRAPGNYTPVRYWQIGLRFDYFTQKAGTPAFTISAGWY